MFFFKLRSHIFLKKCWSYWSNIISHKFQLCKMFWSWDKVLKKVQKWTVLPIYGGRILIELNRWILIQDESRKIFCSGKKKKFWSWNAKKFHLLKNSFFPCIFHYLFELGTFLRLLSLLGTVVLIRTWKRFFFIEYLSQNDWKKSELLD